MITKNFAKYIQVLLAIIVLLAVFLRFFQLGGNPPGINWDETAWGYNAYSLGVDGRDEFGVFLPLQYIESFGDFKPPLYAYLTILPVKLFGLTEFATRFASVFFGSLTVLLTYFLVRKLFTSSPHRDIYAYTSAFLLAVSPWHIMLSRAAFEANIVTFLLVLGVWLFLKGVLEKGYFLMLAAVPFALSFYTFNTARIVTPLLVLLLGLSFIKPLITKKRKETIVAIIIGLIMLAPVLPFLFSEQASLRFKEVNIFSDLSVITRSNDQVARDDHALFSRLLHHRYALFGAEFLKHYLDHFNPDFLFIKGDHNPKFSTQDVGVLYLFEIPFFIAGIILLFRKREGYWWIVPLWLLIGIIPAATARETPHALRIESTLPMFQLFSAYGIVWFLLYVKQQKKRLYPLTMVVLGGVMLLNIFYFLHGYYTHYPREYSGEWQYGYKESIAYVQTVQNSFDSIMVSESLGRPYIYYLFYTRTDPRNFRADAVVTRDVFGFVHVDSFAKYHFPKKLAFKDTVDEKILYVTLPTEVPEGATIQKEFSLRNGRTQLVAFTL